MLADNNINSRLEVYVNGVPLSFKPEEDLRLFCLNPNDINIELVLPDTVDSNEISISVGDDIGTKGFEIHIGKKTEANKFSIAKEYVSQICGLRLVGKCALTLLQSGKPLLGYSTMVRFLPHEQIQQYLKSMRADFANYNQAVLDMYGLSSEDFCITANDDMEDESVVPFVMLMQMYKASKRFFSIRFEELHSQIVVSTEAQWTTIQEVRGINANHLSQAYRAGEAFLPFSCGSVNALPLRVPDKRNCISYDTMANRYITGVLKELIWIVEAVRHDVRTELDDIRDVEVRSNDGYIQYVAFKKNRLIDALNFCEDFLAEIYQKLDLLYGAGVSQYKTVNMVNQYQIPSTYRLLIRAHEMLKRKMKLVSNGVSLRTFDCSMQTRSVNHLYELWVVQLILRILVEHLGYENEIGLNERTKLTHHLLKYKTVELTTKDLSRPTIKIYYNRVFPLFTNPFCIDEIGVLPRQLQGAVGVVSKNNPDICLEFYQKGTTVPRMLIFDPTFSNNTQKHIEKSYYKQLIWYRPSPNAERSTWRRIVLSAVAVHPFKNYDDLPIDDEWALTPGSTFQEAASWLEDLLMQHQLI